VYRNSDQGKRVVRTRKGQTHMKQIAGRKKKIDTNCTTWNMDTPPKKKKTKKKKKKKKNKKKKRARKRQFPPYLVCRAQQNALWPP